MPLNKKQQEIVEKLYNEMYYHLLEYARSTLHEHTLVEETVQDTFRIACSKVDDFLSSPNPKGWLLNTLKNVIRNMTRNRWYLNNAITSTNDILLDMVTNETSTLDIDILYSDISDSEDYKLIKKIALEKYTMLDVAQEYGISVEASKKRVQRARNKLKKHFDRYSI